jgi:hypothetical protein
MDHSESRYKPTCRHVFSSIAVAAAIVPLVALALSAQSGAAIQTIDDSALQVMTTTVGGAPVLRTTRTVAHWWGSTVDPHNGVTYGYNMVGADPNNCSGSGCSVTIDADITPLNVIVGGMSFDGSDVVAPTLASPQFTLENYGSTPFATAAGSFPSAPAFVRGPGGVLSQGDSAQLLQLQDATMRAQFNKTGTSSSYHLILNPIVHPAVTIVVPGNKGILLQSGRGVIFADVNIQWWATRIQNLNSSLSYTDPTHLPIYLTSDVVNFIGTDPFNCCVIGFHGAGIVPGNAIGSVNGKGNQPVQTYAWASYLSPGIYARPNGGTDWALQDIHALSHEIAEWSDDPFINNTVEPWLTPTAPQYGCTDILETGDPVVAIGFAIGVNRFRQGPNPNGTQSADTFYHPEDEVYLPWFLRLAPNTVSEPTQTATTNIGRYTLLGTLNPFPGFRQPATGCQ